jgi:hypothetical protein
MKKAILSIGLIFLVTSGCATYNSQLQHPVTKDVRTCQTSGWGWIGAPMAMSMYYDCKEKLEKAGYVMIGEPSPPQAAAIKKAE